MSGEQLFPGMEGFIIPDMIQYLKHPSTDVRLTTVLTYYCSETCVIMYPSAPSIAVKPCSAAKP